MLSLLEKDKSYFGGKPGEGGKSIQKGGFYADLGPKENEDKIN